MTQVQIQVQVFGASWCSDTLRARRFLSRHQIPYGWHDIDRDEEARAYVLQVNRGRATIPTIRFPDGAILVEPSDEELAQKLGVVS
ncbi:MAG: NrdH-redoxin [Dehalococcoidia bacterium]|nr:NrdH-redoxin [Dehalococcoidia bacterium]